jgi:DNA modification methylase
MANAQAFLTETAASLRRMAVKLDRLDGNVTEQDIAGRRLEADLGHEFAVKVDRLETALKSTGSNQRIDQWVKSTCDCDIRTMLRRKRLHKCWKQYEAKRRELGQCGQSGLLFALSLVAEATPSAMNRQALSVRSPTKTTRTVIVSHKVKTIAKPDNDDLCQFITGDALTELPKLKEKSVHCIITSPPYWPAKRAYDSGKGISFEKTLPDYIANLVTIFNRARRVLRDDGTLWISIDDSYVDGDLMFIPTRLAMAMQADGWVCRSEVIWKKRGGGRPDSVTNRPLKDHEKVLLLTKRRNGYHYDGDPIRVPLIRPYAKPGRKKPSIYRRDNDRTERVWGNPMGRSGGSVWEITPANYQGNHAATMPEDLVRKCLLVSCPENGLVLDPFGGAATTALVALKLGHHAISIEINPSYTKEGRERVGG